MFMKKYLPILVAFSFGKMGMAQTDSTGSLKVTISTSSKKALDKVTVMLLKQPDSTVTKIQVSDSTGFAFFPKINPGKYFIKASCVGYNNFISAEPFSIIKNETTEVPILMDSLAGYLKEVTVQTRKPFIELQTNKTVINMEASLTNIGTSVLEALEKLPGITIDRNGNIALKGKPGVLILVDGKQTYLGGAELSTYLSGLSSDQVSEIEIIEHPSAKYEAEGNAGIINIKTKKSKRQGVYGSIVSTYAQARFPKSNSSLNFNFHKGPVNFFVNYNLSKFGTYVKLYAYRKYLEQDNVTVQSVLVQDFYMFTKGYTHTIRTGLDYTISPTASLGITLNGVFSSLSSHGSSIATWENNQNAIDSSSSTALGYFTNLKNKGIGLNFHKAFSKTAEWNIDADLLGYKNGGTSSFENTDPSAGSTQTYLGNMPGNLHIISAKSDFDKKDK